MKFSRHHFLRPFVRALLLKAFTPLAFGAVLYSTDFSNFPDGDDQFAGFDGWQANTISHGSSGIGYNLVGGLGNSAWLGYGQTTTNLVRVYRDISPASNSIAPARIQLNAIIGVEASISGGNDLFAIAFYNTNGAFLAALNFDTALASFGIWRDDGKTSSVTEGSLTLNQLHAVALDIDFQQNIWSAFFDGVALFQNASFTSTTVAHNAGSLSLEWAVTDITRPGDNWFLMDNLTITSPDLQLISVTRPSGGGAKIVWTSAKAGNCQVQTSTDLVTWTDLPGAVVPAPTAGASLSYLDQTTVFALPRFYRIRQ